MFTPYQDVSRSKYFLIARINSCAVLTRVNRKTSYQVSAAIVKRLKPFTSRVKTITYDNGKEFEGIK